MLRLLRGAKNRFLQYLARFAPGAMSMRVSLHRLRGVKLGKGVFIGTDVLIETEHPSLVSIGNGVGISMRTVIIAHFRGFGRLGEGKPRREYTVRIEDDVYIGPGVIVLPNVTIGAGAVVSAGSVVTRSVRPLTMVQGNPARPVAKCGVVLGLHTPLREFYRHLEPLQYGD